MTGFSELAQALWPGGVDTGRVAGTERYAVLPSLEDPRLLVPLGSPRAAAATVRYSVEATGDWAVLRRQVLATAFRSGVTGLAVGGRLSVREPEHGLPAYLSTVLGAPAVVGVRLGPARANRKPVATVLRRDGRLLGYAKLGVNPLTDALVNAEAEALRSLTGARLGPVKTAAVVHHRDWKGRPLLLQEPLPVWLPRSARPAAAIQAAQVAVARCLGTRCMAYQDSRYAGRLSARLATLESPDASRLAAILGVVSSAAPVLEFGAWHGDWNGANSAVLADGRVLVWDWERFDPDVPIGFDAVHLALQAAITRQGTAPRQAATDVLAAAGDLLAPFGVGRAEAPLVGVLYLVELAVRYVRDRQAQAGARLGRVADWLLPAVEDYIAPVGAPGRRV
jgi:hypothetical protein